MDIRVSVVIPVFNGETFVALAVRSALNQTIRDIEVLVADNGSTDGTWGILEKLAAEDPRVKILRATEGRGPDVGRNAGLDLARGEWVAMLDADDVMHPQRLERLLAFAAERGADVVADNLRLTHPDGTLIRIAWKLWDFPDKVDAADFVIRNQFGRRLYALGYVKPLIRRQMIEQWGLRYHPRPRIVEDYQFMYSLLRCGAVLHLLPEAYYDYVQMPGSLSRMFNAEDLAALKVATQAHMDEAGGDARLRYALEKRMESLDTGLAHKKIVAAVKKFRLGLALKTLIDRPGAMAMVLRFGYESIAKRLWRRPFRFPAPPAVAYFGQDCTDNGIIRRMSAFQQTGLEVHGFTFRRHKFNRDYVPTWNNVALGVTRDRDYKGRMLSLIKAMPLVLKHRRTLKRMSFLYARNIDMALLAWFGKIVSGSTAPLVYEILDVQRAFVGAGLRARVLRWVERKLLDHSRLLVVSSPGFAREYFLPVQGYKGDWFLLENKIVEAQMPSVPAEGHPPAVRPPEWEGRWVIGWFGTLRCVESLRILCDIARELPDKVVIYMRGFPTETGLEPFLAAIKPFPNMIYQGEFFSPRDLPEIYGVIDFAWGFDFLDAGANSDWLLPNRYYDAGYFNVPLLAASATQTGRSVDELEMGRTFSAPFAPAIAQFMAAWSEPEQTALRNRMLGLPRSLFREEDDTRRLVRAILSPPAIESMPMSAETPRAAE